MVESGNSSRIREATHAGTWYVGTPNVLDRQLDQFLSGQSKNVKDARILLGPHAGYSYAGPILAKAYGAFDPSRVKRVFIMGPSHHVYFSGSVMTSRFDAYDTPLGQVPVDKDTISDLMKKDRSHSGPLRKPRDSVWWRHI